MGNSQGSSKAWNDYLYAPKSFNVVPDPRQGPTFDPMLGFPNGRKVRELPVSKEDMENWQIPGKYRNYCAHKYIDVKKCYRQTNLMQRLFLKSCEHPMHDWHSCLNDERILGYKEYEREKRLLARQKRRITKGLEEAPELSAEAM